MHELSIAHQLFQTALDHLPHGKKLDRVLVTVGPLSGISPDSLSFCFEAVAASQGQPATQLTITTIPAVFACACGRTYEAVSMFTLCPHCDSMTRTVVSGDRFTIDAIETKDSDNV